MTASATQGVLPGFAALTIERAPTSHELRFTFGERMAFDRVPAIVLFPDTMLSDAVIEARGLKEGDSFLFPASRRHALIKWFAGAKRIEQ